MNAAMPPGAADQLDFLVKLQRILNEGFFTASYKYALILCLAESSVERASAPDGTLHIPLRELAGRFISLYWRQSAPFKMRNVLAQNTGGQATAIVRIAEFRQYAPTLAQARKHPRWHHLVNQFVRLLVEMPLWKLQAVGQDRLPFLYEERVIDDGIVLCPGIADCFRSQYGIVQAIVQMAWLSFVQKLPPNKELLGTTGDLADFLFGSDRANLGRIVDGLRDMQSGRCFYCARSLKERVEVDHFIPWAQYGRDLGHNFVLAHRSCNQDKRDMLAATPHLARWLDRNLKQQPVMREIFESARFIYDLDASLSVAEWSYERAERANALVWVERGHSSRLNNGWRVLFSE